MWQAPISRPTLTELSNSGTTYVNCQRLQISPSWTPLRTLSCLILCTYLRPLLMLTTTVPGLWSEPAPAIASHCILKKISPLSIYLFIFYLIIYFLIQGSAPHGTSRPVLTYPLSASLLIDSVLLCVWSLWKSNPIYKAVDEKGKKCFFWVLSILASLPLTVMQNFQKF